MSDVLQAGRELDALVAERVMGHWDVRVYEGNLVHGESNMNGWPMPTPHYSTDIAAAWEVVEKMAESEAGWWRIDQFGYGWDVHWNAPSSHNANPAILAHAAGPLPLAICLAALKACTHT